MQPTTQDFTNSFIGNWVILWCWLIVIMNHRCCHHHCCCVIIVEMGVCYQLLKDWVVFLLLFFMLFLLLFLSCYTTSYWRSSSISVLLLIEERLLCAFIVDRYIALKSPDKLSTKILMLKYDTLLVLSSGFSLDHPGQSAHPTAAKLSGWGFFLSPCSWVKKAQLYRAVGANTMTWPLSCWCHCQKLS